MLVDRALMRLGEEVERYGGTVDKYIGDNVMAIFGAPVAHEDDAERAVRAGLGMQAAMGEVNDGLPSGVHFDLRVGVNTGEVLAGAVGQSYTVTGDTVNVAARLQSAARPGSVTVGERTMRATLGAVRYEVLEPLELKGKAEPVPGLGGRGRDRRARGTPHGAGARVAAGRPGQRAGDARGDLRARRTRRNPAPGHAGGRGRRGQVAHTARARAQALHRPRRSRVPHGPLPAVRDRHRLLGAGRGDPRRLRDRRERLRRGGVEQAGRPHAQAVQG